MAVVYEVYKNGVRTGKKISGGVKRNILSYKEFEDCTFKRLKGYRDKNRFSYKWR